MTKRCKYQIAMKTAPVLWEVTGAKVGSFFGVHKSDDPPTKGRYALTHIPTGYFLAFFDRSTTAQACGLGLEIGLPHVWGSDNPMGIMPPAIAALVGSYVGECAFFGVKVDFLQFVRDNHGRDVQLVLDFNDATKGLFHGQ